MSEIFRHLNISVQHFLLGANHDLSNERKLIFDNIQATGYTAETDGKLHCAEPFHVLGNDSHGVASVFGTASSCSTWFG